MMTVPAFEINQIDSFQNGFDSYYMWFQNVIFSVVLVHQRQVSLDNFFHCEVIKSSKSYYGSSRHSGKPKE